MNRGLEVPPTARSGGSKRPDLPLYRLYLQELNSELLYLCRAVRTPFTCLLDATRMIWVLAYPVTSRGHVQTGEGYHGDHGCGNSYTRLRQRCKDG